jgi:hypothetical protein
MPPTYAARRPAFVTIVLWGVFLFGSWQVGTAVAVRRQIAVFDQFNIAPDPRFQIITALFWALLFVAGWWFLRQRRPWSRHLLPALFLLFALTDVGGRWLWSSAQTDTRRLWYTGLFYFCWILFTFWALNRPGTQSYFMEKRKES